MKNTAIIFLVMLLGVCCSSKKDMTLTIENPSSFDRTSELIEISLDSIKHKVKLTDSLSYIVTDANGKEIPSQITYDRKLIFQPDLKAKESKTFIITTAIVPQKYTPKTYGRFVPERKDDFAWENDRIAFRIYGPAVMASDGPSNGIDIWYKRTNDLIIDKWYKDDLAGKQSYHEDHGEGLDDYKVGRSLGAGAMAPYVNNKLWLNDNFQQEEIFDNGPLRTTFKLTYKDVDVAGKSYAENRIISIDAGSQLSKITQAYSIKEPMQVAGGIVKRGNDSIISSKHYIIYAEPKSEKIENVYIGLVFPEAIAKTIIDTYEVENPKTKKKDFYSHVLGVTTQQAKKPLVYYTGYGWSKFGFSDISDFEKYIHNFSESLKQPFIVIYN